jgi:hypothetical protein
VSRGKGNYREDGVAYLCSRVESVVLAGCMASVWEEGGGRKPCECLGVMAGVRSETLGNRTL